MRSLGRFIGSLCRKQLLRKAEGKPLPIPLTVDGVTDLLGAPRYDSDEIAPYAGVPGTAVESAGHWEGVKSPYREIPQSRGSKPVKLTARPGKVFKKSPKPPFPLSRPKRSDQALHPASGVNSRLLTNALP